MPEVSRFFGIIIRMWWDEHNPPHFHAFYQGFEAVYSIENGGKMEGSFPKRQEKIVIDWSRRNTKGLLEVWNQIRNKEPFYKIEGADR